VSEACRWEHAVGSGSCKTLRALHAYMRLSAKDCQLSSDNMAETLDVRLYL